MIDTLKVVLLVLYLVSLLGSSLQSSEETSDSAPLPPRPNLQRPLHISREEEEYLAKNAAKPNMVVLPSGLQVVCIVMDLAPGSFAPIELMNSNYSLLNQP